MMRYYSLFFPYPTHMDLPIRQHTGSICPVCQSFFAFVNQECKTVHSFPLVYQLTFLQLDNFHTLKDSRGIFKADKFKMWLLSHQ